MIAIIVNSKLDPNSSSRRRLQGKLLPVPRKLLGLEEARNHPVHSCILCTISHVLDNSLPYGIGHFQHQTMGDKLLYENQSVASVCEH